MEQPEKNRIREDFEMWITFIPDEVIELKKCFLRKDELIKFYKKENIVPIWIENFNSEPEEDLLEPFHIHHLLLSK